jgi:hypothetical protein
MACKKCNTARPPSYHRGVPPFKGRPWSESKRERLDRIAAEMRAYNLTHGTGCKSTARAIAARLRKRDG